MKFLLAFVLACPTAFALNGVNAPVDVKPDGILHIEAKAGAVTGTAKIDATVNNTAAKDSFGHVDQVTINGNGQKDMLHVEAPFTPAKDSFGHVDQITLRLTGQKDMVHDVLHLELHSGAVPVTVNITGLQPLTEAADAVKKVANSAQDVYDNREKILIVFSCSSVALISLCWYVHHRGQERLIYFHTRRGS